MKTVKDWFELLSKDIRVKAYANTYKFKLNTKESSLFKALDSSFVWANSPEGQDYWIKAANLQFIKKPTQKHLATFRLSKDCRDKLKQLAEEQKISQASIIEKLVKNEKL